MPLKEGPLSERVQSAYEKLTTAAAELNAASDDLGLCVADLDAALKKLNLGVTSWVTVQSWGDDEGGYSLEEIGYDKVDGKWGVALRTRSGHPSEEYENVERWLFNDASRALRLQGIGGIPELLDKLSKEAAETTEQLKRKLSAAKEVASAVKQAAEARESKRHVIRSGSAPVGDGGTK
jgi:septation ring formation regulator EzrA